MEQLALFAKEGVLGVLVVVLGLVCLRLFNLLMKTKDEQIADQKVHSKELKDLSALYLEALNEQTESNNRLAAYVQGVDRLKP